jgi:ABC-type sugar transport system ATPase subunit
MANGVVVQLDGVTKRFPGVIALDRVSMLVQRESCHGLVGENGAGKSTLGRTLGGICAPDEGQILVDGRPARLRSPRDALARGITAVHQELSFCEDLSVAENVCLGRMPTRGPFVSWGRVRDLARRELSAVGASMDVEQRLGDLSIGRQQIVQIAGAIGRGARVVILDEPTSSLSRGESEQLFQTIARLRKEGVTFIYISHRLDEVFRLCDAVTVLRDGRHVATHPTRELQEASLVQMMIGRTELLRVQGLSSAGRLEGVSFRVRAGEVLGFAGLVGSGRTEVVEALFGLDPAARGRVWIGGRETGLPRHPRDAIRQGVGLMPEDRKRHGLVLSMSAKSNISLPRLGLLSRASWIDQRAEESLARRYFDLLDIRAAGIDSLAATLSGGNQQKLVLARWLAAACRLLIVDEPTRGIDVGAKAEIHGFIDELARQGTAVLLISSDLPEVLNMSTRLIVMRRGRIAGELSRQEISEEQAMGLMAGVGTI